MVVICDVYDVFILDCFYKCVWDLVEVIFSMVFWIGYFDCVMFLVFVKIFGIYLVGFIVKLEFGCFGFVIC